MYWLIGLMTFGILAIIAAGFYYDKLPDRGVQQARWFKPAIGTHLTLFVIAQLALLIVGVQDVMAATEATGSGEISFGTGLAIIGIGMPTAFSTIAAAIAVGPIGAASLAVLAEKPEIFGRTLIYLGLAEGIAIYGLVISILLLDKI
ncbi:MAG: ATPase [Gammaproteobacteria bacterium]|nr:ATPase [Gammaproteobacteria bacterium]MCB1849671.1 ATPase [Gammaproteobacteria bacterium]MCP5416716.1 ATPase [Chromatiaceae bacterium]